MIYNPGTRVNVTGIGPATVIEREGEPNCMVPVQPDGGGEEVLAYVESVTVTEERCALCDDIIPLLLAWRAVNGDGVESNRLCSQVCANRWREVSA